MPDAPATDGTARLFVASWPSAATRGRVAAERDRWRWAPAARVVADRNLHVTLHFIGPVRRERVGEIAAGLRVPIVPCTLDLGRHVVWHGGIAVLEPATTPVPLSALHAALGEALQALSLPIETRLFRPHVTLARRASGSTPPAEASRLRWPVDGYALVESRPGPRGGYVPLAAY